MKENQKIIWALLRVSLGFIFLWAFLDKLVGLGFATASEKAWIVGSSPTIGFLKFGTEGKMFESFFQPLGGNPLIDILFMVGLLLIGVALILGVGIRIASIAGSILLFLMWLASLPLENNPLIDDHIVYIIVLLGIMQVQAGDFFGFGKAWSKSSLVKKYPLLK